MGRRNRVWHTPLHRWLLLGALGVAVSGCTARPPVITRPPTGAGWTVQNQSYNWRSSDFSSATYGDVQVTTVSHSSRNDLLEGTPIVSHEKAHCAGKAWVKDCDFRARR